MPKKMIGDEQHVPEHKRRKTLYFDSVEVETIETVRELLKELDRVKYGQKKVQEFEKQGRYSFSNVVRIIITETGKEFIKELTQKIEEEKKKKASRSKDKKEEVDLEDPLARKILTISPLDDYYWDRLEVM